MYLRFALVLVILLSFSVKNYADQKDTAVYCVFSFIYNQQFDKAEKMLNDRQNQIDTFYLNILNLDLYWWKFSLSKSKTDAEEFKKVLSGFDSAALDNQQDRINKLIQSSYEMRYEVKRYNLVGALILRSDVRKQVEQLKSETLQISPLQMKLFNLYVAIFQYLDYSVNLFSFGKKPPELQESLNLLEKYSKDSDLILSTLAHYFLGRIDIKVDHKTEEGREHFRILAERFPENSLFPEIANGTNTRF